MIKKARKSVIALGATLATGLGMAMADGSLTGPETVTAIGAALVAGALVWRIPNASPEG